MIRLKKKTQLNIGVQPNSRGLGWTIFIFNIYIHLKKKKKRALEHQIYMIIVNNRFHDTVSASLISL